MSLNTFTPDQDIPSLAGKIIFLTGGTAGLGQGTINELAKHNPARIVFTGRKENKAAAVKDQIAKHSPHVDVQFIQCDITSFQSVREAAQQFLSTADRLDILFLNAGIMATPPGVSTDGYEIQFATNYLGHALLVDLLMPLLETTAAQPGSDVRVVNMSSVAYKQAPKQGIDFATVSSDQAELGPPLVPGHTWSRYGQSKLAQLLYSAELAKRHPQITSIAIHPGVILTGLFADVPFFTALPVLLISLGRKTPVERGHYNQCWGATTTKANLVNGAYYEAPGKPTVPVTKQAKDIMLAAQLWDWTQGEISKQ